MESFITTHLGKLQNQIFIQMLQSQLQAVTILPSN